MSILTELKKLTKKKNATVVSQALPDSLDGSGSGGANVLTLYVANVNTSSPAKAFKDHELTERYVSFDEAANAVRGASSIKVEVAVGYTTYFANSYITGVPPVPGLPEYVNVNILIDDAPATVVLYTNEEQ